MDYVCSMRVAYERATGKDLVDGDGHVIVFFPSKVRWVDLVRRSVKLVRSKTRYKKNPSVEAWKIFSEISPGPGKSPKAFVKFLHEIRTGTEEILPQPES